MGRYISITEYLHLYYTPASRPARKTVCRWIRTGQLPAVRRGKQYWIDTTDIEASSGDPLVDRVLQKHRQ